jgi:hypothetical protein
MGGAEGGVNAAFNGLCGRSSRRNRNRAAVRDAGAKGRSICGGAEGSGFKLGDVTGPGLGAAGDEPAAARRNAAEQPDGSLPRRTGVDRPQGVVIDMVR